MCNKCILGQGVEASVDGVLGGYGNVNDRDVIDSKAFLAEIFKEYPQSKSSNLVALGEFSTHMYSFLSYCRHVQSYLFDVVEYDGRLVLI